MLTLNKIIATFQNLGYQKHSKINYFTFKKILDQLRTQIFDDQVATQLWQQTQTDQSQQVQVLKLCQIILQAQQILTTRIAQTNQAISYKNIQLQSEPQNNFEEIRKINEELEQLKKDKKSYQDDLRLVTDPFEYNNSYPKQSTYKPQNDFMFKSKTPSILNKSVKNNQRIISVPDQQQQKNGSQLYQNNSQYQNDFKTILVLVSILSIIEIIVAFLKFNNFNVHYFLIQIIICLVLLSIFLLNYFDTFYLKLSLGLILISILLDIAWLVLNFEGYWSPPLVGLHIQNQRVYMQSILCFTIINILLKLVIEVILYMNRIVANKVYNIVFFEKYSFNLYGNKCAITQVIWNKPPVD